MFGILKKEIHQSYFVVFLALGVIVGTILALVFRINYFTSSIWIVLVVIGFIYVYLKPKYVFVVVSLILGMILAFFRCSIELKGQDYIRRFYERTVIVSGIIDGDTKTDESGTSFKLVGLKFGEEEIASSGSLYVSGYKNEKLERGDLVTISGKMAEGFGTYAGYMYRPKVVIWKRAEPGDLILKIRNWFSARIKSLISEEGASLGLSYLLGMKAGLSEELNEKLRIVGLVHIVVASGAHLSILVSIARKIFERVSRFAELMFSILFVGFFMSMVGFTPSNLVLWFFFCMIEPWRMIILMMSFSLMINPMFVIDLGWLLSFASFSGIMMVGPWLIKIFYGERKPGFFGSTIITTVSATLMTLPITLYFYGQISLISVLANLLILPTLPYAMGLVFLVGVFLGIPGVEMIVSFLATKLLDFHILIIGFFGEMKSFLIQIPTYQGAVFLLYLFMAGFLIVGYLKNKKRRGFVGVVDRESI